MNLQSIISDAQRLLKTNAPALLTGIGAASVVTTGVLAARGAFKASQILAHDGSAYDPSAPRKERVIHKTKLTWQCYVPAVSAGAVGVVAILGANHAHAKQTAAAVTAYTVTEAAFSEYRDVALKQLSKAKAGAIQDEIAQRKVNANPPDDSKVVVVGEGKTLCCELHTGRYFMSSMEAIRQVENSINWKLNHENYTSLDDFYYQIGLPATSMSGHHGWEIDKGLLHITYTSVLTPDGRPCLAFEYSYLAPL